jgi:hypothetical protein
MIEYEIGRLGVDESTLDKKIKRVFGSKLGAIQLIMLL